MGKVLAVYYRIIIRKRLRRHSLLAVSLLVKYQIEWSERLNFEIMGSGRPKCSIFANSIALILIIFVSNLAGQQSEGKITKCRVDSKESVKYKLIFTHKNSLPPYTLVLNIVVKQKDFNTKYMTRLAKTVSSQFCHENEISVTIFDDARAAKRTDIGAYLAGEIVVPELRGFYSLQRDKKFESIEFSTKRGNPPDEIKIDLLLED